MIVLVSLIVYIGKKTSCFHYFSHGASLHHCSFSRILVSRIFVKLAPVARMRKLTALRLAITC